MRIVRTTDPDGRSSIKPKGQDPERPSILAFESTEGPMCHIDRETSRAGMMKPRDLGAETEKK